MKIIQKPNPPLIVFLTASVIANLVEIDTVSRTAHVVAVIAGVIWAYLEISDGANWVRRLLGLIVLAIIAFNLYR